jgi:hypothetical protein
MFGFWWRAKGSFEECEECWRAMEEHWGSIEQHQVGDGALHCQWLMVENVTMVAVKLGAAI